MAKPWSSVANLITDAPSVQSVSDYAGALEWLNGVIAFCKNDKTEANNKTFPSIIDDANNYAFKINTQFSGTGTALTTETNNVKDYVEHIKSKLLGIKDLTSSS